MSVDYAPDDLCGLEADWTQAIADVEEACAEFCSLADLDPRMNYRRHFEQVSAATSDLLSAALRLDVVSNRLGEQYAAASPPAP